MKKSIMKGVTGVMAAALVLCVLFTAFLMNARITRDTETSLVNLAWALARSYDAAADDNAQAVAMAGEAKNLRVTIIAADGTVLGDSAASYLTMPNHADRAEIKAAQGAKVGVATRASNTLGKKQMYAAVRMADGNYLRLATEYAGVLWDVLSLLPALLAAGAVAFALAMGLATRFAASIAAPIAKLSASLKTVQDGGTMLNVQEYPYEELQTMAGDINRMAQQIESNMVRVAQEKNKIDYILNNMREGFVLLDEAQNVLLLNTAACTVFGCSASAARGKNLVHATRNLQVLDTVAAVLQNGGHAAVEMPGSAGQIFEATVSSVCGEESATVERGAILLISDVTEKRSAVKMRQQFFESASHELKTPITSIKGFAELLCGGMTLSAQQQTEISQRILKETTRMNSLIGDIIMISRLESGDILFDRELLDLGQVVREVCADFAAAAAQSHVSLQCEAENLTYSASRREMTELIGNLVSNAIRYNFSGGSVRVCFAAGGGAPVLTVFNTGEPIPQNYTQRVFERFFRLDKGRSKATGGTGLGLAIVKHIATGYHAKVFVVPSENGNTFTVEFPAIPC